MINFFPVALLWVACYVVGSVPIGLIAGRLWARVDIRRSGSGNIGTTNVLRTLGFLPAVIVLLLDVGKGLGAVAAAAALIGAEHKAFFIAESAAAATTEGSVVVVGAALAAVAGHNWSLFLRFRGGRGIATAFGVLVGLSPLTAGIVVVVFGAVAGLSGYVSLGSITVSVLVPVILAVLGLAPAYIVMGIVLALWSVIRHRDNIQRLRAGTENRFGRRGRKSGADTDAGRGMGH